MMLQKVTNLDRIVTDSIVLRELARQGIDKDYVEFFQDYAPRSKGKEHSPYAKFYRDLKSGKKIMVVSGLPMVNAEGVKVEVSWIKRGDKYLTKPNVFSAVVDGTEVKLTCLNDQPYGAKKGDEVTYQPQLFLNNIEVALGDGKVVLLKTDPVNPNYHQNVLEWDYSICQRRLRVVEGGIHGCWIFPSNPNGDVRIKYNQAGSFKLKLGEYAISDDEEIIPANVFNEADYPFVVSDSATFYPDADPENSSVDGRVRQNYAVGSGESWATIIGAAGNNFGDSGNNEICFYIVADETGRDNLWVWMGRGIILFDTSGLPDDANISAAVLSLYGQTKTDGLSATPDVNVYSSNPASNTALENGDYDSLGSDAFCDTPITYAGWNTGDPGDPNDFTYNATGIAAIPVDGVHKAGTRNVNYDIGASAPNWVASQMSHMYFYAADKGTGYKPKLVVTYTLITEKTSSDTGSGVEALTQTVLLVKADSGSGLESLGDRIFSTVESGLGTETSLILASLLSAETGSGLDALIELAQAYVSADTGAGVDALTALNIVLTQSDTGTGLDTALLLAALVSSDHALSTEVAAILLKALSAADHGMGIDRWRAKIETPTKGGDIRLPRTPGQTSIPSGRVSLPS